ncbi:MAG: hypothetical protein J7K66_00895 [Anaerolineaceae bacterium]|nr:hypothetical protein [Anaerolineaceae bacterium]
MNAINDYSYIPSRIKEYDLPLNKFIPPLSKGIFPTWIEKMGISKHLLIDPVSANPLLPVELAASGYRVLSARGNPIIGLITEIAASAPTQEDFSIVLNKLFNTRYEQTTLFDHLKGLYLTPCANCGKMIQSDGFIWEKGKDEPISRVYHCQFCADEGVKTISDFDLENLGRLGNLGIHRSRAFQRVLSGGEYEQASLRAALDCYLPRALYVCMLLVNRLERLSLNKDQEKYIHALLLSVFDDAHSLKHWPPRDYRFLQLSVPIKFFECNLFLSLQTASQHWEHVDTAVKVSYWPDLPEKNGGICFYKRNLPEENKLVSGNIPTSITTIFPRPSQAFWTLSAVWSGWLWGNQFVNFIRSALGRRRYDWYWFAKAVHIALRRFSTSLEENTLALGILPQFTPNLVFGLFAGMHASGFELEGSAFRVSDETLQCQWKKRPTIKKTLQSEFDLHKVINQYLTARGEPVEYRRLIMQTIIEYTRENRMPAKLSEVKESDFSRLQNLMKRLLAETSFLRTFPSDLPGGSRWWLLNEKNIEQPISEKIELLIRNILFSGKEINLKDLDQIICEKFTGGQTPEPDLIDAILQSYAVPKPDDPDLYKLRFNESANIREEDLKEIKNTLKIIGTSFGLKVTGNSIIYWKSPNSKDYSYIFYPTVSTEISQFVFKHVPPGNAQQVIVFPGSRSSLIYYRLQHDPRFSSAMENRWHFLKFRYLRRLAKKDNLDLHLWMEMLDSDPPLWDPPTQLQFL